MDNHSNIAILGISIGDPENDLGKEGDTEVEVVPETDIEDKSTLI